jgi:hypothetical protein
MRQAGRDSINPAVRVVFVNPDRLRSPLADDALEDLLDDRSGFANHLAERVLQQLWRVEDRLGWEGERNFESWIERVELAYRAAVNKPLVRKQ